LLESGQLGAVRRIGQFPGREDVRACLVSPSSSLFARSFTDSEGIDILVADTTGVRLLRSLLLVARTFGVGSPVLTTDSDDALIIDSSPVTIIDSRDYSSKANSTLQRRLTSLRHAIPVGEIVQLRISGIDGAVCAFNSGNGTGSLWCVSSVGEGEVERIAIELGQGERLLDARASVDGRSCLIQGPTHTRVYSVENDASVRVEETGDRCQWDIARKTVFIIDWEGPVDRLDAARDVVIWNYSSKAARKFSVPAGTLSRFADPKANL
jgi:hypothetical protein